MKRLILTIVLCTLFGITISYSKVNPWVAEAMEKAQSTRKIAYSINIPSKQLEDGSVLPAKTFLIEKLDAKDYIPNAIHIKTKTAMPMASKSKVFPTTLVAGSLKNLNVKMIRAPFAEENGDKPLSSSSIGVERIYEVFYDSPVNPYDICMELMKNPDIEYAVPIFRRYTFDYTPDDPKYASQYYLTKLEAKRAWDITAGGDKKIKIAIVDSGTDWVHQDLFDNIWKNLGDGSVDSKDNDNNGKVDDIHGWDFVGNASYNQIYSGQYLEDNDPKPSSKQVDHGTHVAGCAAAVLNNKIGIAGLAGKCSIIPIKCASDNPNVNGIWRGYEAILYAAKLGAHVINCSWGGPGSSPAEQDIINQATQLGSLVVVAAGNDGDNIDLGLQFPACYENVLCVGASTSTDAVAGFTNWGHVVTVYTPGAGILSTLPDNNYGNNDGTSMASPITAGLAALVRLVFPDYTPRQVIRQIRSTCDNVFNKGSLRPQFYGRTNAYKALTFNNPKYPDRKIPGVDVALSVSNGDQILTNNNPKVLNLNITNHLSPTSALKIKVTPMSTYISVKETELNIGALATKASKDFQLNVQLSQNNPWFSGTADVLLTFEDGTYTDYQLVQIPIQIKTSNIFTFITRFPDYFYPVMSSGFAVNKSTAWFAGFSGAMNSGLYVKLTSGGPSMNFTGTEPIHSIFAFDANTAYAGAATGTTTKVAKIYKTTTGGSNWSAKDVSHITSFVNGIHFYSTTSGVFVGDPANDKWGIAKTSDGGSTWLPVTNAPGPLVDETCLVGCFEVFDQTLWFGSNKGKIYKSTNGGTSWNSNLVNTGSTITDIAFSTLDSGVALYGGSADVSSTKYLAYTKDGGKTWTKDVFNFDAINIKPIAVYPMRGTNMFIIQAFGGEMFASDDMGKSWIPVLSTRLLTSTAGTAYWDGKKMKVWNAGNYITSLEFDKPVVNVTRIPDINSVSEVKFDSTSINGSLIKNLELKNKGNSKLTVTEYKITPIGDTQADEFKTIFGSPTTLEAEAAGNIRIKFVPTKAGERKAKLTIITDGIPSELYVNLVGYGKASASNQISTNGVDLVSIDTTKLNSTKTAKLTVFNKGNSAISISSINLNLNNGTSSDELTITNSPKPSSIAANSSVDINFSFSPKTKGNKGATLVINSNGDPATLNVDVKAVAIDGTNVFEINEISNISVSPNPASDFVSFKFTSSDDSFVEADIVNINGEKMIDVYNGRTFSGANMIMSDLSSLSSGVYYLRITKNGRITAFKFVVNK